MAQQNARYWCSKPFYNSPVTCWTEGAHQVVCYTDLTLITIEIQNLLSSSGKTKEVFISVCCMTSLYFHIFEFYINVYFNGHCWRLALEWYDSHSFHGVRSRVMQKKKKIQQNCWSKFDSKAQDTTPANENTEKLMSLKWSNMYILYSCLASCFVKGFKVWQIKCTSTPNPADSTWIISTEAAVLVLLQKTVSSSGLNWE